jgi:KaiC/GvpD/RAD55 family RecA-like ATPase
MITSDLLEQPKQQINEASIRDEFSRFISEFDTIDAIPTGLFQMRTANKCLEDAKEQPIPRELYPELIFENEITIMYADTGIGKSVFATQIADCISRSEKVLYLDLELSDKQFEKRYSDGYKDHYQFRETLFRITFNRRHSIPEGSTYDTYFIESLKDMIMETGARVVIIDNMTKLISGDTDTAKAAKPLMDCLCDLKFEFGLTMLLLEHTRKTDASRPIDINDLQGSKMKVNFADSVFSIGRSSQDKNFRYIKQLKCRSSEIKFDSENVPVYEVVKENSFVKFVPIRFDVEAAHLKQISETDREERILTAKKLKEQGKSNRETARILGVSEGAIRKWLSK